MIVVVSDTHSTGGQGHRLEDRTLEAVREADLVLHLGDFITTSVLDTFVDLADAFAGVHGNNDSVEVCARLPSSASLTHDGLTIAMAHGHRHDKTALGMLGRQEEADLVVWGHAHNPDFDTSGPVPLLNPGSHAQPRGNRPGHAELDPGARTGRLVEPDGTVLEAFDL